MRALQGEGDWAQLGVAALFLSLNRLLICVVVCLVPASLQSLKPHYAKAATILKASNPDVVIAKVRAAAKAR